MSERETRRAGEASQAPDGRDGRRWRVTRRGFLIGTA